MFENHFALRENPFVSGHQPRFVFPSPEHQEALAHLRFGIENREPFVLITGEVGTGKTTALYDVLGEWKGRVHVALINNSALTRSELLEEICLRLGFTLPPGSSKPQVLNQLERHLLAVHGRGERAILLLDEAQNLDRDLLEEIRLLSNLESQGDKLLQVFLVGQPELEERLSRPELRQLRQRISVHYRLKPMTLEDTERYIHHRITVAGGYAPDIFPIESCRVVYDLSHGIPREINHICAQALLGAFVEESQIVKPEHVRAAAAEIEFQSVMRHDAGEAAEPSPRRVERRRTIPEYDTPRAATPATAQPAPPAPVPAAPRPPAVAPRTPAPVEPTPPAAAPAPPSPVEAQAPMTPPAGPAAPSRSEREPARPAAPPSRSEREPVRPAASAAIPPIRAEREFERAVPRAAVPRSRTGHDFERPVPPALAPPNSTEHMPPPFVPPMLRPSPSTVEDVEGANGSSRALGWMLAIATLAVIAIAILLAIRFGSKEAKPQAAVSPHTPSAPAKTTASAREPLAGARDSSAGAQASEGSAERPAGAHESPSGAATTPTPAVVAGPASLEPARATAPTPAHPAAAAESARAERPASAATEAALVTGAAQAARAAPPTKTSGTTKQATPAATNAARHAAAKPAPSPITYGVAVGTYLDAGRAETERTRLAGATKMGALVRTVTSDSLSMYELVLGSYTSHDEAERAASDLIARGLVDEARVVIQARARTPR